MKTHIALNVASLEKSLDFYGRMLAAEPAKVHADYAKFDLQEPPLNLSLNATGKAEKARTLSHLGLQVPETRDVLTIRNRWSAAGLNPRDEMQTRCCYALQDKAWVTDPDGNEWEVFTVLEDIEQGTNDGCCGKDDLVVITR